MGVQMSKGRKYSDEFKREAVALMENRGSRSIGQVASDIGVSKSLLYGWRERFKNLAEGKASNGQSVEDLRAENLHLKKELDRVQKERELLKKSIAFFVKENG